MKRNGSSQLLIAAFTAISSLFTGSKIAPKAQTGRRLPVVLIVVEPSHGDTSRKELKAAVKTLRQRFPGHEVTLEAAGSDGASAELPAVHIRGTLMGTNEALIARATTPGGVRFLMTATEQDASALSIDLEQERSKANAYLLSNMTRTVDHYNALSRAEGGSPDRIMFASEQKDAGFALVPLFVETKKKWRFDENDLNHSYVSVDPSGQPALGFEIAESRQDDFEAFTVQHQGERLAIVIGTRIVTRPRLSAPLRKGGVITGGALAFSVLEAQALAQTMSAPRLEIPLKLVGIGRTNVTRRGR